MLLIVSRLRDEKPEICKALLQKLFGLKWGGELWYDLLEYDVLTWYKRLPIEDKETLLTHPFFE